MAVMPALAYLQPQVFAARTDTGLNQAGMYQAMEFS